MERKAYQGRDLRDVRDGERFREGRLTRDAFPDQDRQGRDGFQENRDGRSGFPGQGHESFQGRGNRYYQDEPKTSLRGWDHEANQNRKRESDRQEVRDVRRMTEEDLRHKLEERKKGGYQPQGQHARESGQAAGSSIRCFNCNDVGHHISVCKKPPFCYSCRESGHKSSNCPSLRANKGLTLCATGMSGQLFYALNLPEIKKEEKEIPDEAIRAIVSVLEGRGTKFRIKTELQYLVDSEWNWDVKRISGSDFIVNIPSKAVMSLLAKMNKIKFITSDVVAVIEETDRDPDTFQILQTVWVRAVGIPKIARTEFAVLELAKLVGDPEEVHLPSLQWKAIWIKVSCKDPYKICGASEVFINKKGKIISWFYSDKLPQYPPSKPENDDFGNDDGEVTDEEDPESQDSHGWLETGKSPPKGSGHGSGPSNYQGRQSSILEVDKELYLGANDNSEEGMLMGESKGKSQLMEKCNSYGENTAVVDVLQEIKDLAEKVQNSSILGANGSKQINQTESLADWGFLEVDEISTTAAVKLSKLPENSGKVFDPTQKLAIQQETAPSQIAMEVNAIEMERSAGVTMQEQVAAPLASKVSTKITKAQFKDKRGWDVAKPPKCLGPPTPVIVLRTSDGDAGDPPTLEVR